VFGGMVSHQNTTHNCLKRVLNKIRSFSELPASELPPVWQFRSGNVEVVIEVGSMVIARST
jgi:hypothetical protein